VGRTLRSSGGPSFVSIRGPGDRHPGYLFCYHSDWRAWKETLGTCLGVAPAPCAVDVGRPGHQSQQYCEQALTTACCLQKTWNIRPESVMPAALREIYLKPATPGSSAETLRDVLS
jgi:hypothetical protein